MNQEILKALTDYIDAAVELGVALHAEAGGHDYNDGDDSSCWEEKKKTDEARTKLFSLLAPRPFPVESGMVYDFATNSASVIEKGKTVEIQKDFLQ
jgi:hypothetical protein